MVQFTLELGGRFPIRFANQAATLQGYVKHGAAAARGFRQHRIRWAHEPHFASGGRTAPPGCNAAKLREVAFEKHLAFLRPRMRVSVYE